jgi:hypothetical protein
LLPITYQFSLNLRPNISPSECAVLEYFVVPFCEGGERREENIALVGKESFAFVVKDRIA